MQCKGFFNFNIERQGECKKQNKFVCENGKCEFWKKSKRNRVINERSFTAQKNKADFPQM